MITANEVSIDMASKSAGNNKGVYLNYTRIEEEFKDKYNLSPRKAFCGVSVGSDYTNNAISDPDNELEMSQWRA